MEGGATARIRDERRGANRAASTQHDGESPGTGGIDIACSVCLRHHWVVPTEPNTELGSSAAALSRSRGTVHSSSWCAWSCCSSPRATWPCLSWSTRSNQKRSGCAPRTRRSRRRRATRAHPPTIGGPQRSPVARFPNQPGGAQSHWVRQPGTNFRVVIGSSWEVFCWLPRATRRSPKPSPAFGANRPRTAG